MKYLRVLACLLAVLGTASGARAQMGLYGAPELLRLDPGAGGSGALSAYPSQGPGYGDPAGYPAAQSGYPDFPSGSSAMPVGARPAPLRVPAASRPMSRAASYVATNSGYEPQVDSGYSPYLAQSGSPQPGGPSPPPGQAMPGGPPQGSSVVNQMLEEYGRAGVPGHAVGRGYACGVEAGPCADEFSPGFQCEWYVSAAGLIMTRDQGNRVWTTYETGNNPNQLMNTEDADAGWQGGYEVRLGRRFFCGQWAVEGVYWSIDGFDGSAAMSIPGGTVSTPLIVDGIEFGGINGTVYFDGAAEHRIWRRSEVENVEINLIRTPVARYQGSLVDVQWLVGVRYFRFEESLTFGSLTVGGIWGGTDPDEAYLRDRIHNNLIGCQVGLDAGCQLGYNLRVFFAPKIGIYNNHIENRFDAYRGDGVIANPTAASGVVGTYPVVADKNTFAFLGQIDLGLDWQFHPRWNAFAGYRVVAATGIGLADHQIPTYVVDLPELANVKDNGQLILHGAFAGLKFNF